MTDSLAAISVSVSNCMLPLHAESTGVTARHEMRLGDNSPIRMITQSFADDVVVNAKELAQALRVSRWTVARWREEGYQFEFGNRSTPGHLKAWLRERAYQGKTKMNELANKLARLR